MTSSLSNRSAVSWQRSPWIRLATLVLVVGFLLLRPKLDAWLNGTGSVPQVTDSQDGSAEPSATDISRDSTEAIESFEAPDESQAASGESPASKESKPAGAAASSRQEKKKSSEGKEQPSSKERLTEIRPDVYESLAGLIYGKGSEDGHRLKHILQHADDEPSKKVHGVFEGDREKILEWIDDAWTRYQKQEATVRSSLQNSRIVITAKMNQRIGYVGGEEGERKGHPECRFLRLVVDKPNKIVTAYPVQSF